MRGGSKGIYPDLSAGTAITLVSNGAIILGIFNLLFFPIYFKNTDKIGVPFIISTVVTFLLVTVFIVLRWATPLYFTTLNGLNIENFGAKAIALAAGVLIYGVLSAISCKISMKNFQKVDV